MNRSAGRRLLLVTTISEDARRRFEAGRHAAFHYQATQAREHLDAAIAADPAFVLAYLHRGGMSLSSERGAYFDLARANRDRVTEDEGRMVDAFHAFLWDGKVEDAVVIFSDLADRTKTISICPRTLVCATYPTWRTWTRPRSNSSGPPAETHPSRRHTTGWARWLWSRETIWPRRKR